MAWGDFLKEGPLWQRKVAQLVDQIASVFGGTSTGSTNAYVLDTTTVNAVPAPVRLIDGELIRFVPNFTNTGASTLTVSSEIGSRSIVRADGTTALAAGDIVSNIPVEVQYDAANNAFRLIGNGGSGSISTTGNLTATSPVSMSATRQVIGGSADISMTPASASDAGYITTDTQTIAGAKTFSTSVSSPFFASGSDPANAGAIRLSNNDLIAWQSSPAGSNVTLRVNSLEQMVHSADFMPETTNTTDLGTTSLNYAQVHSRSYQANGVMTIQTNTANSITMATNGTSRLVFEAAGTITSEAIRNSTTASAANVRIDATTGLIQRSTSAGKYKTAVKDLVKFDSDAVLNLRPVKYKSLGKHDDPKREHLGLIAEEVEQVAPWLVEYFVNEDGEKVPDGVQYDRLPILLLAVVKEQKARIDSLEARLTALENRKDK